MNTAANIAETAANIAETADNTAMNDTAMNDTAMNDTAMNDTAVTPLADLFAAVIATTQPHARRGGRERDMTRRQQLADILRTGVNLAAHPASATVTFVKADLMDKLEQSGTISTEDRTFFENHFKEIFELAFPDVADRQRVKFAKRSGASGAFGMRADTVAKLEKFRPYVAEKMLTAMHQVEDADGNLSYDVVKTDFINSLVTEEFSMGFCKAHAPDLMEELAIELSTPDAPVMLVSKKPGRIVDPRRAALVRQVVDMAESQGVKEPRVIDGVILKALTVANIDCNPAMASRLRLAEVKARPAVKASQSAAAPM